MLRLIPASAGLALAGGIATAALPASARAALPASTQAALPAFKQAALPASAQAALPASTQASTQASARAVAPAQPVVSLGASHAIYRAPGRGREATIAAERPITGEATTLPVLATRANPQGQWLLVRLPGRLLPGRPNDRSGWIRATRTRLWAIHWHIFVSLHERRARVYDSGRLRKSYPVVVGAPASPTPLGQFFVEENIAEPPSFPGAPYALATSARSEVFSEFDGGPGQVALHGIGGGLGGTPGTAASHGCVRFTTPAITWLAQRIYPGTPVTITP